MREYASREEAENDPELNLRIIWACNKCDEQREDYPGYNEGGPCDCGGTFQEIGESYNA